MAVLDGAVREVGKRKVIGRGRGVMTELVQQVGTGGGRHAAHAVRRKTLQLWRRRAAVTDRAEERTAYI